MKSKRTIQHFVPDTEAILRECDTILRSMRVWTGNGYVYHPKKARQLHNLIEILMEDAGIIPEDIKMPH